MAASHRLSVVMTRLRGLRDGGALSPAKFRRHYPILCQHRRALGQAVHAQDAGPLRRALPPRTFEHLMLDENAGPGHLQWRWLHALHRLMQNKFSPDGSDVASMAYRGAAIVVEAMASVAVSDARTHSSPPVRSRRTECVPPPGD